MSSIDLRELIIAFAIFVIFIWLPGRYFLRRHLGKDKQR